MPRRRAVTGKASILQWARLVRVPLNCRNLQIGNSTITSSRWQYQSQGAFRMDTWTAIRRNVPANVLESACVQRTNGQPPAAVSRLEAFPMVTAMNKALATYFARLIPR